VIEFRQWAITMENSQTGCALIDLHEKRKSKLLLFNFPALSVRLSVYSYVATVQVCHHHYQPHLVRLFKLWILPRPNTRKMELDPLKVCYVYNKILWILNFQVIKLTNKNSKQKFKANHFQKISVMIFMYHFWSKFFSFDVWLENVSV
jgi:hypothetical protein